MANINKNGEFFCFSFFKSIQVENAPLQNGEKSQGSSSHKQPSTEQRKPPLPITSPKKPISQAEFQALLDAGYKVSKIFAIFPRIFANFFLLTTFRNQGTSDTSPRASSSSSICDIE